MFFYRKKLLFQIKSIEIWCWRAVTTWNSSWLPSRYVRLNSGNFTPEQLSDYPHIWSPHTNPTMYQSHIPQCTILWPKCAHVCTFLLQNGSLWDICVIHCGIYEPVLLQPGACGLVAWWHQAITWTNVDLLSVKPSDIHIRRIAQEIPQSSSTKISLKFTYVKFH